MSSTVVQNEKVQKGGLNRPYWFAMGILAAAILFTAMLIVKQTQERHKTYASLAVLEDQYRRMHITEQRLLIEQQTFSSTPVVAKRAVNDLRMFYPDDKHRKVIAPPDFSPKNEK